MAWPFLPIELYTHILSYLEPSRSSDHSVQTLANCLQAHSTLYTAASTSELWQGHYLTLYTRCEASREDDRWRRCNGNWRLMYVVRRRLDREALDIMRDIVSYRRATLRLGHSQTLATVYGLDVWDALKNESMRPLPSIFCMGSNVAYQEHIKDLSEETGRETPYGLHALPWRFWTNAMLGAIGRRAALRQWEMVACDERQGDEKMQDEHPDITFEDTLTGLSAFFEESTVEITCRLDTLAKRTRRYLEGRQIVLDPSADRYDSSALCLGVLTFLRDSGFDVAPPERFHELLNHFPHRVLTTHKQTIPMSLIHVYIAVARRVGINAYPLDFPARVLVRVDPPYNNPTLFIDACEPPSKALLSLREDIIPRLECFHVPADRLSTFLSPASSMRMLLRTARNIFTSTSTTYNIATATPGEVMAARVAATYIIVLNSRDPQFVRFLLKNCVTRNSPLDLLAVLRETLASRAGPAERICVDQHIEDTLKERELASTTCRSRSGTSTTFFVGLAYRHEQDESCGVIIGWDPHCEASEEWINLESIDQLSAGRMQPFYTVLTTDGAEKYLPQEFIQPIGLTPELARALFFANPTLGRYFRDAELHRHIEDGYLRGRFLCSAETVQAYPDDEAVGTKWVTTGILPD